MTTRTAVLAAAGIAAATATTILLVRGVEAARTRSAPAARHAASAVVETNGTRLVAMQTGALPRWETSASGPLRPLPENSAYYATNNIATWAGYTFGCEKNGYNDHIYLDLHGNQTDLTVCSWVAVIDADGADNVVDGQTAKRRASNALPALFYTPNVERSAPDILDGAWGWGTNAVTVSGSLSFDYGFPAAGTSGGGGGLGDLVMTCENFTSRCYGYTLGPLNGTYRFTVPFETDMGWTGYVLEGQTPPANMGDLSSMEPVICDPATGGNLVMLWGEGLHEQLSIKDLYTDHPSVDHYFDESYSGTISFARVSAEPPFWESVWWNGGVTGTNCFPRGVYTVAWTNLTADMTLSVGGETMTLDAPAGTRNVRPGSGTGFTLTGNGKASVGISRMKIEPIYKTDGGYAGDGANSASSWDRQVVSSNFCFVAHRVHLDGSTHTNDLTIVQRDGSRASWGASPELPPDGCGSLRTNGLYQLVYTAFGDLKAAYVYEWDRRQYASWLTDAELRAVYEDGLLVRNGLGYPACLVTNCVWLPNSPGPDTIPALAGARRNWYAPALLATNPPLPSVAGHTITFDALVLPEGLYCTERSAGEFIVAERPMIDALVGRYRAGLAPAILPVNVDHAPPARGLVTRLWAVAGSGLWARIEADQAAVADKRYISAELLCLTATATDSLGTWGTFSIPWHLTGVALTDDPAIAGTHYELRGAPAGAYPDPRTINATWDLNLR